MLKIKGKLSNNTHAFSLGTLIKVRGILSPLYSKKYMSKTRPPELMNDVINMFEHFGPEEPSEAFERAPNVVVPPLEKDLAKAKYEAGTLGSQKENFLTFHFLLSDFSRPPEASRT